MKLAQNLNKDLFTPEIKAVANRDGYGEALKALGQKLPRVVALTADLSESTRTNLFAEAFPERFIQCGVAEQNMASVASGLAAMGKIPFIASYAMFSPGRSWEQVRTTIAYNNANVKIIGSHAGVSVGPDGATHQAIEDIALMRVMSNMIVLAPMDVHEAYKATMWAAEYVGPVYMRLARNETPIVSTPESEFIFGKASVLMEKEEGANNSVAIISTGTLAYNALQAGKELNESGIATSVTHFATIKPLDTEMLDRLAATHDILVTVEEHQVACGLGSAIAEYLSATKPTRIIRLGIQDKFGQSGTPEELLAYYGLDAVSIVRTVKNALGQG